jgi:hypothetical protein
MDIRMDKTCKIKDPDGWYIGSQGVVYYAVPYDTAKPLIDAGIAHEASLAEMAEQLRRVKGAA